MAAAIGAIKGFFHIVTGDVSRWDSPQHMVTILDVLESLIPNSEAGALGTVVFGLC